MKFTKLSAGLLSACAATALAACSSSDEGSSAASSSAAPNTAAQETTDAQAQTPTAADLNAILARAADPNVPLEEKTVTVQGGQDAPELFDTMAKSQAESGAVFEVVDPVLPGLVPDSALATVNFSTPDGQGQTADQVEFIYEDGHWKLSKSWACTLVTNIVPPEEVPAMCADTAAGASPADQAPMQEAPAEGAPAEGAPGEEVPAQ